MKYCVFFRFLKFFFFHYSRYPVKYGQNSVSSIKLQSGNYYTKDKTEDFKVFQTIPASSHLLAHYDPFYSPLLSRIDTVFKQLGYAAEPCRERLVCLMYKNPAKFAPYSNLVSAQLSRSVHHPLLTRLFVFFIIPGGIQLILNTNGPGEPTRNFRTIRFYNIFNFFLKKCPQTILQVGYRENSTCMITSVRVYFTQVGNR